MSTFSSPGSAELGAEADLLCVLIGNNAGQLRAAGLGSRFQLENCSFRLYAKGRNTIYRVSRQYHWFLKLPPDDDVEIISRERLGTETTLQALGSHPHYRGAGLTRDSLNPPYLLATSIPGKPLNTIFFTECWIPGARPLRQLEDRFRTLGVLLARLHAHAHTVPTLTATTRPFEMVRNLLNKAKADRMVDTIARWYDAHKQPDGGSGFIHGNARMDNVLSGDSKLGLVDFENCGTGSFYQDLSRPVSQLLLTRAVLAFPHTRATRCVRAFVDAYAQIHPFDNEQLWAFVGARQARYYLESHRKGRLGDRVGGLPTIKTKVEALTRAVLGNGPECFLSAQAL